MCDMSLIASLVSIGFLPVDIRQYAALLNNADAPARATRAIQLGVLVGFVVVAPKFNPKDQDLDTMRAMCK